MPLINLSEELERAGKAPEPKEKGLREVKKWQIAVFFILPILLLPASFFAIFHSYSYITGAVRIPLFILFTAVTYTLVRLLVMGCIYMYKAFAPLSVRNRCRYTPSCSQYTLISVGRYGIIIGALIGVLRIQRCKPPFGGSDPPRLCHILRLFRKCEPGILNGPNN